MTLKQKKIIDALDTIPFFLEDMQEAWKEKAEEGQEVPADFKSSMEEKIMLCKEGKVSGVVLYEKEAPVAIGWVEKTTPCYGNVTMHSVIPSASQELATVLVSDGHFDQALLELVQVREDKQYSDVFKSLGLEENERKRMYLWLDNIDHTPIDIDPYHYDLFMRQDTPWSGQLSFNAHQVSQDYNLYPELQSPDRRQGLDERVFDGLYGPVNQESSIKVCDGKRMVGYCFMVNVACWGYEAVPWVFDICVDPEFQGRRLGRALLQHVISILVEKEYPIMGLAVTKSNQVAIALYESLGFETLDTFFEYIKP